MRVWVILFIILLVPAWAWSAMPETVDVSFHNAATGTANGPSVDVSGYTSVALDVAISSAATVTFEGSVSGASNSFQPIACTIASSTTGVPATTRTGSDIVFCSLKGLLQFRVRISSYVSGTVTVFGRLSRMN